MKTVICADSLDWLPANRDQGSIVTSLPDACEIGIEDPDQDSIGANHSEKGAVWT